MGCVSTIQLTLPSLSPVQSLDCSYTTLEPIHLDCWWPSFAAFPSVPIRLACRWGKRAGPGQHLKECYLSPAGGRHCDYSLLPQGSRNKLQQGSISSGCELSFLTWLVCVWGSAFAHMAVLGHLCPLLAAFCNQFAPLPGASLQQWAGMCPSPTRLYASDGEAHVLLIIETPPSNTLKWIYDEWTTKL